MRNSGFRVNGPQFEWEISEITLTEYSEDGFLGLQVAGLGATPGMPTSLAHHTYGFLGRPSEGEEGKSALALVAREGDEVFTFALGDPSIIAKLPQLKKGGSVQYCRTGTYASMDGEDGTWTLYVPCAFSGETCTEAHLIQVGLDPNGKKTINLVSASGVRITLLEDELVLANATGDTWLKIDATGGVLAGNWKVAGGMAVGQGTMVPVALAPLVQAVMQALATAFSSWTPVPNDGGAALKTLLSSLAATGWPQPVAAVTTVGQ